VAINKFSNSFLSLAAAVFFCFPLTSQVFALKEAITIDGSNAKTVHEIGQTAAGINVGLLASKNIYTQHEAFFEKDPNGNPIGNSYAFNYDVTGSGISPFDHDTWMAGIIASRGGAMHPNDTGTAPDCNIHCVRVIADSNQIKLTEGLDKLINDLNCRVITAAFALDAAADGQSIISLIYDYYAYTYNTVVFAHAAGNNGIGGIQVAGDAFNGITTGGLIETGIGIYDRVGIVSGQGPTADARKKPDITAPSNAQRVPHSGTNTWIIPPYNSGETSLAVPHTAGTAALLVGSAEQTENPNDGCSEVIRAVIVNSAFPNIQDRYGNTTNPANSNNTWHPDRGYGRIDAFRAYQLLSSEQISKDTPIEQFKGWNYALVNNSSQQDNYFIAGSKNQRLVLTVTWNRKINRSGPFNYSEDTPKFNLNLTIKCSDGTVIFAESDSNNNLKKVDLLLPADDTYTINLTNPGINQSRYYGLAFELIPPVPADLNLDYIVDANDLDLLKKNWLLNNPIIDEMLFEDGIINLKDFAVLADSWQLFDPAYYQQ